MQTQADTVYIEHLVFSWAHGRSVAAKGSFTRYYRKHRFAAPLHSLPEEPTMHRGYGLGYSAR
ncbi:hypothetical protein GCM10007418_17670 [Halopseudomonas salina]|uniref:Uncharacterized protein n=1 Tax=Halopseudomonas salina TaxID=1323744 RepID=A0ABQ1PKR0_9GAMM|nr:hypothetical protein GCM10007418_17670 [Halopseudomonas salina]